MIHRGPTLHLYMPNFCSMSSCTWSCWRLLSSVLDSLMRQVDLWRTDGYSHKVWAMTMSISTKHSPKKSKEVNSWTHVYLGLIFILPRSEIKYSILFVTSVPWQTNLLNIVFECMLSCNYWFRNPLITVAGETPQSIPTQLRLLGKNISLDGGSLRRSPQILNNILNPLCLRHSISWKHHWITTNLDNHATDKRVKHDLLDQ